MSTRESIEADAAADRFVDECEATHTEPRDDCRYCAERAAERVCAACECEVAVAEVDGQIVVATAQARRLVAIGRGASYCYACKDNNHSDLRDGFGAVVVVRNSDNDGELEGWRTA